ncbi:hypothetical protein AHAS_Ahas14G0267400 [Arachis hypogaea]
MRSTEKCKGDRRRGDQEISVATAAPFKRLDKGYRTRIRRSSMRNLRISSPSMEQRLGIVQRRRRTGPAFWAGDVVSGC